jgi:tetratricopeptide (TPR) repeat protein
LILASAGVLLYLGGLVYSDATIPNEWVRIPLALFLFALALLLVHFGTRIIKGPARKRPPLPPNLSFNHLVTCFSSSIFKDHLETFDTYLDANDLQSACDTAAQLLQQHPNDRALLWLYTDLLLELDQPAAAELIANRLLIALTNTVSSAESEPHLFLAAAGKKLFAIMLQSDGRFESECTAFLRTIISDQQKITLLDQLACIPLVQQTPEFYQSAEFCIRKALQIAPESLTLKGTLGALLAERNDFASAEPLLRACHQSPADNDRGITSYYLALLAENSGDFQTARRLAKQSIAIYRQPWLIKKANTLLNRICQR